MARNARGLVRSLLGRSAFIFFSIACALLVFELVYRHQLVDTYAPELASYNLREDLSGGRDSKTILIMGDSMTAGVESYPAIVRRQLTPTYRVINAAVSGTCALEGAIIGPRRFATFKPSIFLYQVYVGNDLFETRHPTNWKTISIFRNSYWLLSNHLRSLVFINYRSMHAFVRAHALISSSRADEGVDQSSTFSARSYTRRSVLNLRAEPRLLYNTIMLTGGREKDFEQHLAKLEDAISHCKASDCRAYVLVIPHCCQVDRRYLENMRRLGAEFGDEAGVLADEYPFLEKTRRAFLRASNVTVMNPLPALRAKEAHSQLMYLQNDEHLTSAGQAVIADFVLRSLRPNQGP